MIISREMIEARCAGCEHCAEGCGTCLPSLRGRVCLKSSVAGSLENGYRFARYTGSMYRSIYAVEQCPECRELRFIPVKTGGGSGLNYIFLHSAVELVKVSEH